LDRASNPVQFHYKFTPGVKDDEGTRDLTVEIPTGEKTFVSFGAEDKDEKRKYKATWGFRF
jgi:hypothetical protein